MSTELEKERLSAFLAMICKDPSVDLFFMEYCHMVSEVAYQRIDMDSFATTAFKAGMGPQETMFRCLVTGITLGMQFERSQAEVKVKK